MKKIILLTAVISAFTFASCKKDHTCTCTGTTTSTSTWTTVKNYDNSSIPNATTTGTNTNSNAGAGMVTIKDAKKKDAKKYCIDQTTETTNTQVDSTSGYDYIGGNFENYTSTTTTVTKNTDANTCSLK